jgi:hypothetical protein
MLESDGNELDRLSFAQRHGAALNKKGGYYRRGKQYGMEKKLVVAETYLHYEQLGGGRPSLSKIASEHKVDRWLVRRMCSFSGGGYVGYGEPAAVGTRIHCIGSSRLLCPLLLVPQEAYAILTKLCPRAISPQGNARVEERCVEVLQSRF